MKLKFGKEDSIYKIYKTIDKISSDEKVYIFISPENKIFNNIWWGKQILSMLKDNDINYVFCSQNKNCLNYYDKVGLNYIEKEKNFFQKILRTLKNYFLEAKKFHIQGVKKKNIFSFFLVVVEIIIISFVFYSLYRIVSHSATIYIKPSYEVQELAYNFRYYPYKQKEEYKNRNYLSVPYFTGKLDFDYKEQLTVENAKYLQKPSKGQVKLFNETSESISLVANTKLVTDKGLIFRMESWSQIPSGSKKDPGVAIVDVKALERDVQGSIQGDRGNIDKGKRLEVQKLSSNVQDSIYGKAVDDFNGGKTFMKGKVTEKDIDILKSNLKEYVRKNKKNILGEKHDKSNQILLNFKDNVEFNIDNININAKPGENESSIVGRLQGNIKYDYVKWKDLEKKIKEYIDKRQSESLSLVDIDRSSLMLIEKNKGKGHFIIPTKIDVVFGYNFAKDVNSLKDEIIFKVAGKTKQKAREIILNDSEIDVVIIKITPPWYNHLPIESKIDIEINKR